MSSVLVSNGTAQSGHFAIPHLVLQSFDDPISTWTTNAADDPSSFFYPTNLVRQNEFSNLTILLTAKGGHVGWPMGFYPHNWDFMNSFVAAGFVSSYADVISHSTNIKYEEDGIKMMNECNGDIMIPTTYRMRNYTGKTRLQLRERLTTSLATATMNQKCPE